MSFSTGRNYAVEDDSTMITDHGEIIRIYSDDTHGSRHQRFVVRLKTGQTILILHNIDIAKRIPIRIGDWIEFRGEYEFNDKGGLVHWTHHCPRGEHDPGWIEHAGISYS